MDRGPSDRHSYSNRVNAAYLEQWCGSSSKDPGLLSFILIYVITVQWICRDRAGGARDVEHELCGTLSARVGQCTRALGT
jgi:hypothetical protein